MSQNTTYACLSSISQNYTSDCPNLYNGLKGKGLDLKQSSTILHTPTTEQNASRIFAYFHPLNNCYLYLVILGSK